ncbi:MAG TPA: D-alanyl-D-alanine endopeptidase [Burkholderiaceae bacterium]|nr:D-alanyl-D-alanine endopeptidase [Burkholderiaceae bacterium]
MHKAIASLISLLSLVLVLGYMAGEAQAAEPQVKASSSSKVKKSSTRRQTVTRSSERKSVVKRAAYRVAPEVEKPTLGQQLGLHGLQDELNLKSNVALVVDQSTGQTLFEKNTHAVLPIASITKLMTALVVLDANLPLDETIEIDVEDRDTEKNTRSRLGFGTALSRADALHLALMASENRAASALGRHYPGGIGAFVKAMNRKAAELGMTNTRFVDSSGLSPSNRSSAPDLAKLVKTAYEHPLIREYSTSPSHSVQVGRRMITFNNTNRLVRNSDWNIGLQKTGYISEAGQCLVMQAEIAGRKLVMVLLDAQGRLARIGDAGRIRTWLEHAGSSVRNVTTVSQAVEKNSIEKTVVVDKVERSSDKAPERIERLERADSGPISVRGTTVIR